MTSARISRVWGTILLTITIFSLSLPAYAKYSGGTGEPNDPYQIATAEDLMLLGETPEDYDKHFILCADIDLDPNLPGRKVFDRAVIGSSSPGFTGVFDGKGHTISHLTIVGDSYLALFGLLGHEAEVQDFGVVNVNITSSGHTVGGLVGDNEGNITSCYSTGSVIGNRYVGGLVGSNGGRIYASYSTGMVHGDSYVGGLVGENRPGWTVNLCYSTGTVTGGSGVGGLAGRNGGEITNCYNTSAVSGDSAVGGLVGANWVPVLWGGSLGFVDQCYSTGAVSGTENVGGLLGENKYDSTDWGPGGEGIVSDSFWDTQTSGQATSDGGTGKTTAEMQDKITFMAAGWDLVSQPDGPHDIWAQPEGGGYLNLCWQLPPGFGLPTFSGGTGEPNDPYHISTTAELNVIGHNPRLMRANFNLVEDIDLEGIDFHIIGSESYPFTGIFDGNDHTVSHLTIAGNSYLGMFGQLGSGGELTNIVIEDVDIAGTGNYIGGLVGQNYKGTVTRCCSTGWISGDSSVGGLVGINSGNVATSYSSASVTGAGSVGGLTGSNSGVVIDCNSTGSVSGTGSNVGGLVGENWGTVTHCYSSGAVSGSWNGGLVGTNKGNITSCYSTGSVIGNWYVGGLVGINSGNVATSYSTGVVSGSAYVGGLVGRDDEYPPRVTHSVWDMEASGQSGSAGGVGLTTAEMMDPYMLGLNGFADDPNWILDAGQDYPRLAWEGTSGEIIAEPNINWMEGKGTPENPYQIETFDQLIFFVERTSTLWDRHFVLSADIDLDQALPGRRVFEQALIPIFTGVFDGNGHVISRMTMRGENYLGFIGRLESGAEIKNLGIVDVNITGSSNYVGALVVDNYGAVTQCYSSGSISKAGFPNWAGYGGGLVGSNSGSITRSYSTSAITGNSHIGGLVGSNSANIADSYSTGSVSKTGLPVWPVQPTYGGGLVGTNSGSIMKSYSTGSVNGDAIIGGLVGWNSGSIANSYSTGAVSGSAYSVGGLAGSNNGSIGDSYSTSSVRGDSSVGGLVGSNDESITKSYSTGSVNGDFFIGGLVGVHRDGTVTQCYSTGDVTGTWDVGGLIGWNLWSSVTQCFSTGRVVSTGSNIGGLVGHNEGDVVACFWDTDTSGQTTSAGGTGKTTAEMQTAETFLEAGWDFVDEMANGTEDIWWIDEGQDYPRLWWELTD